MHDQWARRRDIIRLLSQGHFVSGEALASELGISRAAVSKQGHRQGIAHDECRRGARSGRQSERAGFFRYLDTQMNDRMLGHVGLRLARHRDDGQPHTLDHRHQG